MATEMQGAEATQESRRERNRYVLRITLENGEEIRADGGSDPEAARQQLAAIHAAAASDAFAHLGSDTVVRSREIRYVQLVEADPDDDEDGGVIDTIRSRIGGGDQMTSYDTEQGARAQRGRTDDEGGWTRGFDEAGVGYGRRPWSETKPFFLTSEFLTFVGIVLGLVIAMGALDNFNADRGWLLITVIGAAYMIARGLAKSGTRDPNPSPHDAREYR